MPEISRKRGQIWPVFRIYYSEAKKQPWLIVVVIISIFGIQAADLLSPLYLREFFNLIGANIPNDSVILELTKILGIVIGISFFGWTMRRIHSFSIQYFEARVMADLLSNTFEYLLGHSYQFFLSQFTGTLTRRVSRFAYAFETMFDALVTQFLPTSIFVIGAISVLFIRNRTLGLIMGVWAVIFVLFQIYVAKLRQPLRVARAEEDSHLVGMLSDSISNQNTVTLFSGITFESGRFREIVERWRKATIRSWNADEYMWAAQGLLLIVINVGLLYGAVIYWRRGLLTIGDFVLIQSYLLGTFERLIGINREFRRLYDAFADAKEMGDILATEHEIKDMKDAVELRVSNGEIEFKNVNFHFNPHREILNDFSLKINGGEKVGLVGPSGSGKSTVTKLILRLYEVSNGAIEIDRQNLKSVTQESLRNSVSFVPQEPLLFHRSLFENIRYGKKDATKEQVLDAAKKAHCHEFISSLPEGYETYVGERGIKLSGGERQRVAIARAILKNSQILVLDEATSSLDSESESLIQDALETLMSGKTVIVIAHRLSTIMKMDRIIVLESGAIVSEGRHNELINKEGLYKKLWSIQAGGFLTEEPEKEIVSEENEEEIEDEVEGEKEIEIRYN